jgi:hypothetical protein
LILVPTVPIDNVENYRARCSYPAGFSQLSARLEIATIPAGMARKSPRENHFIHAIFLNEF